MSVLVLAEHNNNELKTTTLKHDAISGNVCKCGLARRAPSRVGAPCAHSDLGVWPAGEFRAPCASAHLGAVRLLEFGHCAPIGNRASCAHLHPDTEHVLRDETDDRPASPRTK